MIGIGQEKTSKVKALLGGSPLLCSWGNFYSILVQIPKILLQETKDGSGMSQCSVLFGLLCTGKKTYVTGSMVYLMILSTAAIEWRCLILNHLLHQLHRLWLALCGGGRQNCVEHCKHWLPITCALRTGLGLPSYDKIIFEFHFKVISELWTSLLGNLSFTQ